MVDGAFLIQPYLDLLKALEKIKNCMGFQHKILNTWHHQGLVERTSGVTVEAGLGVDLHVNGGS